MSLYLERRVQTRKGCFPGRNVTQVTLTVGLFPPPGARTRDTVHVHRTTSHPRESGQNGHNTQYHDKALITCECADISNARRHTRNPQSPPGANVLLRPGSSQITTMYYPRSKAQWSCTAHRATLRPQTSPTTDHPSPHPNAIPADTPDSRKRPAHTTQNE
jgi:hypothetical protein